MAVEIERKFLVRGDDWRHLVIDRTDVRQAYLSSGERSSTRVRIKDGETATLTVKSKRAELQRIEVEYPISVADAESLLSSRVIVDQQDPFHRALEQPRVGGRRVPRRQRGARDR